MEHQQPKQQHADSDSSAQMKPFSRMLAESVVALHSTIFHAYETHWCPLVRLKPRLRQLSDLQNSAKATSEAGCQMLLAELSLYFLIYSEAANIRHCPEATWFLFWICAHSPAFASLSTQPYAWQCPPLPVHYNLRDWRVHCRNQHQVGSYP